MDWFKLVIERMLKKKTRFDSYTTDEYVNILMQLSENLSGNDLLSHNVIFMLIDYINGVRSPFSKPAQFYEHLVAIILIHYCDTNPYLFEKVLGINGELLLQIKNIYRPYLEITNEATFEPTIYHPSDKKVIAIIKFYLSPSEHPDFLNSDEPNSDEDITNTVLKDYNPPCKEGHSPQSPAAPKQTFFKVPGPENRAKPLNSQGLGLG